MTIDAHHHFWKYDSVDYSRIDDSMQTIRRDFLPAHLIETLETTGVDGVVSVQARQTLAETEWLLDLARKNEFIRGVGGWVDLVSSRITEQLERFAANARLKSVRHVVQGEPNDNFILRSDFNDGIRKLKQSSLAYDILILQRHMPQTIQFVDRHPDQLFDLDHIAKPRIQEGILEPWQHNIRELARRPNVYCKLSGMVTEADYQRWTEAQLKPYFDTVLEAFGANRLTFGSDWPVCLVASEYGQWMQLVRRWTGTLTTDEQARLFGGTAAEAYRL